MLRSLQQIKQDGIERRKREAELVEQKHQKESSEIMPPEEALDELRKRGGPSRQLARAFVKLKAGKLTTPSAKIGIMAATIVLPSLEIRQALMEHWSDLVANKLA